MLKITCSNQIEALLEAFGGEVERGAPFSERVLITSGAAMKGWLALKLGEMPQFGTSLGFRIVTLEEGLFYLRGEAAGRRVPTRMELTCLIEGQLEGMGELKEWVGGSSKRKFHLACELAVLFQKYGRFGTQCLEGWQKELWDKIFGEGSVWTDRHQGTLKRGDLQVDLIGVPFLSKGEFAFLKDLADHLPVRLWHLSPCLHFWGDLVTDKEKKRWLKWAPQKSVEALKQLLSDTHPLLSNWGKVPRAMADHFAEEVEAAYVVSEQALRAGGYETFDEVATEVRPASKLVRIQTDLLFLRNPKTAPAIELEDDSLEIHKLPTPLREVEWAKDLALRVLEGGKKDILILAPDIEPYIPLIQRVFADLPYTISSQKEVDEHPLTLFLNYYLFPRQAERLVALLPGAGFKGEEETKIKLWIKEKEIHKKGMAAVMEGFTCGQLSLSDFELAIRCELFLEKLSASTPPEKETLASWVIWLQASSQASEELICKLYQLATKILEPISYRAFAELVLNRLKNEENRSVLPLGQIRFASLSAPRSEPVGVLILLGMSEGAFPRQQEAKSLDLSIHLKGVYIPSQADADRALFLEVLISAREHLFILWSGTLAPSQLVQELIEPYKSALRVFEHPNFAWDPSYFKKRTSIPSFSENFFKAASIGPSEDYYPLKFTPCGETETAPISLKELVWALKDSFNFYKKNLGLREIKEEELENERTVHLSGLEQWKIRKATLEKKPSLYPTSTLFEQVKAQAEQDLRADTQSYLQEQGIEQVSPLKINPTIELPLHGIVPYTTQEGIIFNGEKKNILEALPGLLLAAELNHKCRKIYCLKDKKTVEIRFKNPLALLQKWINYAAKAKAQPYPFSPHRLDALFKDNHKELEALLKALGSDQRSQDIATAFKNEAEDLFGEVFS